MNYIPHHTAISVRNLDKSLFFYTTLGYKEVHRYVESDGSLSIVHLKLGNSILEIFAYTKNENAAPLEYEYGNNLEDIGIKHIALQVEDIKVALADLRNKGLADENTTITKGRTKVSYFFIKDPDNVWLEIVKDDRYY